VNTQQIEANIGYNIISQQKLSRKIKNNLSAGKYITKKAKTESSLRYKLSLKVKKNSQRRICSSNQTTMVNQHLTNLSKLAKILPRNLILISKIGPTSDSSIIRPLPARGLQYTRIQLLKIEIQDMTKD